jgi:hypothetical protein
MHRRGRSGAGPADRARLIRRSQLLRANDKRDAREVDAGRVVDQELGERLGGYIADRRQPSLQAEAECIADRRGTGAGNARREAPKAHDR